MPGKQEKKSPPWILITIMVAVAGISVYIVKNVLSEDSTRKKSPVATVTLLKSPPPITVKEKPPEPQPQKEIPKKEEIINPGPQNEPQNSQPDNDDTPAGDKLGVDSEGTAGSDNFGLVGKKGGRSILSGGGGFGKISLMNKYAGYAQVVQEEVKKKVMKLLNEGGGIPKGKLQAVIRVTVDSEGGVAAYRIIGSSGNHKMDEAAQEALGHLKISEPPPDGMPRTMDIRISSQG